MSTELTDVLQQENRWLRNKWVVRKFRTMPEVRQMIQNPGTGLVAAWQRFTGEVIADFGTSVTRGTLEETERFLATPAGERVLEAWCQGELPTPELELRRVGAVQSVVYDAAADQWLRATLKEAAVDDDYVRYLNWYGLDPQGHNLLACAAAGLACAPQDTAGAQRRVRAFRDAVTVWYNEVGYVVQPLDGVLLPWNRINANGVSASLILSHVLQGPLRAEAWRAVGTDFLDRKKPPTHMDPWSDELLELQAKVLAERSCGGASGL